MKVMDFSRKLLLFYFHQSQDPVEKKHPIIGNQQVIALLFSKISSRDWKMNVNA